MSTKVQARLAKMNKTSDGYTFKVPSIDNGHFLKELIGTAGLALLFVFFCIVVLALGPVR